MDKNKSNSKIIKDKLPLETIHAIQPYYLNNINQSEIQCP